MLPGNTFHLTANGPDGAWFRIEYSSELGNWTSVCTNQIVNGSIDFIDPDAQSQPARFYAQCRSWRQRPEDYCFCSVNGPWSAPDVEPAVPVIVLPLIVPSNR